MFFFNMYLWRLYKYELRILWIRFLSLDQQPGLSLNAMLKITDVKLYFCTDVYMHHQFIKKGMRGDFLTWKKDMVKQTINAWNHTIKESILNIPNTKTLIIRMDE